MVVCMRTETRPQYKIKSVQDMFETINCLSVNVYVSPVMDWPLV